MISIKYLSIKRHVLLNVLVWIFNQKSLLNDLVYFKFWEPQYMKIKEIYKKIEKSLLNDQCYLNFKS